MNNKIRLSARFLTEAGIIAALYTALTLVLQPFSFGAIQLRVSEALCVLPFFTPAAIPGLFLGCAAANAIGSQMGLLDVIFGSLATLLAALATYMIPKKFKYLTPLPAVIFNGIIIGLLLYYADGLPLFESIAFISIEEGVACYAFGIPLLLALERHKSKIFKH